MKALILILAIFSLPGCHYVDSNADYNHYEGYLLEFRFNNFDYHHPFEVDPYYNDGVFDVYWDFRNIDSDLHFAISLTSKEHPEKEVIILNEEVHTMSTIDFSGHASFYYDHNGELWQVSNNNKFHYVADIVSTFHYGETLSMTIFACEADGDCYTSIQPVRFW